MLELVFMPCCTVKISAVPLLENFSQERRFSTFHGTKNAVQKVPLQQSPS